MTSEAHLKPSAFTWLLATGNYLEVYHLQEISGNSGWDVNGTRLFGSFHWKIPGKNGQPEKVVPFSQWKFSQWKCVFHLQISRLSDQCQSFHGLFSNQAFLTVSCCPQTKMAGEVPLSFEADLQGLFQCGDCHMLLANLESYLHHDCASCVNGMYNFGQFLANPKLSLSKIFARKMLHLRASLFHPKFLFFVSFFVFS